MIIRAERKKLCEEFEKSCFNCTKLLWAKIVEKNPPKDFKCDGEYKSYEDIEICDKYSGAGV